MRIYRIPFLWVVVGWGRKKEKDGRGFVTWMKREGGRLGVFGDGTRMGKVL